MRNFVGIDSQDCTAQIKSWLYKTPARDWLKDFCSLGVITFPCELLDFGCGNGKYDALLSQIGVNVTGIDKEPDCVCEAKKNNPAYTKIINGDQSELNHFKNYFDIIFVRYVLHLIEINDRQSFISMLCESLKPDGYLVIETSFFEQYKKHYDHIIFPKLSENNRLIYPELDGIKQLLYTAGFGDIECKETIQQKPYVLSVNQAIEQSGKLVYEGEGQTAWLRLSKNERILFHSKRKEQLIHMFPSGEIPQVWEGIFIKAKKRNKKA